MDTNDFMWRQTNYLPNAPRFLDFSKAPQQRDITLVVSADMPLMAAALREFAHKQPKMSEVRDSTIEMELDGSKFGCKIQLIDGSKLLSKDIIGTPDEPILFTNHKIIYLVEKGAAVSTPSAPPLPSAPRPVGNGMMIIVTSQESKILAEITRALEKIYGPAGRDMVRSEPLTSGDLAIVSKDRSIQFLIERKSAADFVDTIETRPMQLQIMIDNVPAPNQVLYLIEGDVMKVQHGPNQKARIATVAKLAVRKGARVACVQDTRKSAEFVVNLLMQLEHCKKEDLEDNGRMRFGNNALGAGPKKADYTEVGGPDELIHELCTIHGMSDSIAECIEKTYPTYDALLHALMDSDDPEGMLANIRLEDRNRRLGESLAKKIVAKLRIYKLKEWTGHRVVSADDNKPAKRKKI